MSHAERQIVLSRLLRTLAVGAVGAWMVLLAAPAVHTLRGGVVPERMVIERFAFEDGYFALLIEPLRVRAVQGTVTAAIYDDRTRRLACFGSWTDTFEQKVLPVYRTPGQLTREPCPLVEGREYFADISVTYPSTDRTQSQVATTASFTYAAPAAD